MTGKTPRRAAVDALLKVHKDKAYSNMVLDTFIQENAFSPQDKALFSRLVYGCIEREMTVDYVMGKCSASSIARLHPTVREILRVGIYQLLYMDKIPPSAAVNEAVKLTRSMKQPYAAGLVNALLRRVDRERETLFADLDNSVQSDAVRYSVPAHWIHLWQDSYGEDCTKALLPTLLEAPPQYIRVNTAKITTVDCCQKLQAAEIAYRHIDGLTDGLEILAGFDWKRLAKIDEKWYYYQDTASQYCVHALGAKSGEKIADVCAAPGGKSFTLAQYMQNDGHIVSGDIYPHKCEIITRRAKMLGLSCIETVTRDAATPIPPAWRGSFDRVLCDAPCSGLGVMRRKPELKYRTAADIADLPTLQLQILHEASAMVKVGGVLQYSTCTLCPAENERVAEAFLATHPQFVPRILPLDALFAAAGQTPSHMLTLFPHIHRTDGFFIAGFTRRT